VAGDAVLEDDGGLRVGPAVNLLELLDAEGDTAERQADVGAGGRLAGPVEVHEAEGIERGGLDGGDAVVERLEGRELARPERVHQAAGVPQPGRAHEGGEYPSVCTLARARPETAR
jgi:hypothetical protein